MSFVNEKSFYCTDYQTDEVMRKRLTQLEELGVELCGYGQFGIPNIMSGLYIERVWYANEEKWAEEIKWITDLIAEKKPAIDKAREMVIRVLKLAARRGSDVLGGRFLMEGKRYRIEVTFGSDHLFHIRYNHDRDSFQFITTGPEIYGDQRVLTRDVRMKINDLLYSLDNNHHFYDEGDKTADELYAIISDSIPIQKNVKDVKRLPADAFPQISMSTNEVVNIEPVPYQYSDVPNDRALKIDEIKEVVGLNTKHVEWKWPNTHEGLTLTDVYRLYKKVICVEEWLNGSTWERTIEIEGKHYMVCDAPLYYPPQGLNWVIKKIKELGGTRIQLKCMDNKNEYCYPDYKIEEILPE